MTNQSRGASPPSELVVRRHNSPRQSYVARWRVRSVCSTFGCSLVAIVGEHTRGTRDLPPLLWVLLSGPSIRTKSFLVHTRRQMFSEPASPPRPPRVSFILLFFSVCYMNSSLRARSRCSEHTHPPAGHNQVSVAVDVVHHAGGFRVRCAPGVHERHRLQPGVALRAHVGGAAAD